MFDGEEETVTLGCEDSLMKVIIDKFGEEAVDLGQNFRYKKVLFFMLLEWLRPRFIKVFCIPKCTVNPFSVISGFNIIKDGFIRLIEIFIDIQIYIFFFQD
ncbi:MAG: hypothetical protein VB018_11455 [Lachnospiraceae bacterium]|nr:hypothetical protein [Lachnospiraceae bacterium]